MPTIAVLIKGKVQGVFYRASADGRYINGPIYCGDSICISPCSSGLSGVEARLSRFIKGPADKAVDFNNKQL